MAYSETPSTPFKFNRKQFFPQDRNELLAEFLSLFHRYDYIYKPLAGDSWLSAKSEWKLTDSEILKAISCVHPRFFLGCRSGKATRFAVLDIDAKSKYHNPKELKRLTSLLEAAGLTPGALYRSSISGGWHLYIFFQESIASLDLRRQLVQFLKLNGYDISKGTLEVFPSPGEGSQGQGLRLPLQPGWAWLNFETGDVREERSDLSPLQALCAFMNDLNGDSNSFQDFRIFKAHIQNLASRQESVKQLTRRDYKPGKILPFQKPANTALEHAQDIAAIFGALPPGINADIWYGGRQYYEHGLTAPAQRADAVFSLSHYLFYGDPSRNMPPLGYGYEQEREWAIKQILLDKHNGQSKDISKGRPEALTQAERAAHWKPMHRRDKEEQRYESQTPISWKRENAKRQLDARKRIQEAVTQLEFAGKPFSIPDLKRLAKTSERTLYKHQDLWKPAQNKLLQLRLTTFSHEYNAGVGAACSESKPPASTLSEIMPLGRLAARRVVYELKMRTERKSKEQLKQLEINKAAEQESWTRTITNSLPESLSDCDVKQLQTLLVLYISLVMRSPDEEREIWLRGIISKIRAELAQRVGVLKIATAGIYEFHQLNSS